MRIEDESQLLNFEIRKALIEEINGVENRARKENAYKRYKCYKDQTYLFVLDHLLAQFSDATVKQMQYALCNISITKKIVNKLARVYSYGVKREAKRKTDTKKIEEHQKLLRVNQVMKKLNRFLRLQKNVLLYIKPVKKGDKYSIKLVPLQPYFYDVIEDPNDPETPLGIVLSHFTPQAHQYSYFDPAVRETRGSRRRNLHDGKNQMIADRPEDSPADADMDQGRFIWWSKNFHFVTDEKGQIVSSKSSPSNDVSNPILELPFAVFAEDQDNAFWSEGGDDIVDGSIRINTQLTNLMHIGVTQGYGQLVLSGAGLPSQVQVGPNTAIKLEVEKGSGDAPGTAEFISANPPLSDLKGLIEMKTALLLSTNNLSTKHIAATLSSSAEFPSAIAMIVDMAESTEEVEDQAQVFLDAEPIVWKKIAKWEALYDKLELLDEDLKKVMLPEDLELSIQFLSPKPVMTEKEELEIIEKRKDLGISTMLELIMRDSPGLTEEQAQEKLEKIMQEKMERAALVVAPKQQGEEDEISGNEEDEEDEEGSEKKVSEEEDDDDQGQGNDRE